ncbi:Ribosomal protein L23 [Legionella massiliensis]|uniref:Ribosomal protein L23 n=1 Tax=Legionella massiliensis TaxID=1034943 RepID=A0A078L200_9GAMM|nr:hypothetical protein [Legionella massiliensis]CDZ79221.1 Ribosomal protein L23 [Legionella massiliensis]CEE14959.1 Ras family protein [Legionella massiliensis]
MQLKDEKIPTIKVVLIGDAKQKQEFRRECMKQTPYDLQSTVGIDFTTVPGKSGKVNFQIWDTSGLERFKALSETYYRIADVFILFDNANSYSNHAERVEKYKINTFEFNSSGLGPIEFLAQLEESFINYNREAMDLAVKQAITIQEGVLDKNSPLAIFPKEISTVIAEKLFNQYAFFASSLPLVKGSSELQKSVQEPKEELKSKVKDNPGCTLF